jgi:hypothetical protein
MDSNLPLTARPCVPRGSKAQFLIGGVRPFALPPWELGVGGWELTTDPTDHTDVEDRSFNLCNLRNLWFCSCFNRSVAAWRT